MCVCVDGINFVSTTLVCPSISSLCIMPVHTHSQAYTHMHILVPFQDRKTMGLKVDIADNVNFVMWHVPGLTRVQNSGNSHFCSG